MASARSWYSPIGRCAVAGVPLGPAQLQIDLPLQKLIEHHRPPVFLAEGARLRRIGVAIRLRPVGPHPEIGIALVQVLVQRAVSGELLEQIAFARDEGIELARPAESCGATRAGTARTAVSGSAA